jgi:hypothetical protein
MFIEDLIERVACEGNYIFSPSLAVSSQDYKLMSSFAIQISRGYSLTDKQKICSIKILKKYTSILSNDLGFDVESLINSAQMRLPTRVITNARTITIEKNIDGTKQIIAKFPYDKEIIEKINNYRKHSSSIERLSVIWNSEKKFWEFGLTEQNILFLSTWPNFQMEAKLLQYAKDIIELQSDIESYVPMVTLDNEGQFLYKNTSKNIPPISTNNLIEALLIARKYGVTCWCEKIEKDLNELQNIDVVKTFLKSNYTDKLIRTPHPISLDDIDSLIKYYNSILFIIPGGSELKYLRGTYEFLIEKNYIPETMSVLFRLENGSDTLNCNKFIHDNSLNNLLSDNIKFVFISGKVPKPLIESNKKFDLVLNFGSGSAHYTLQNFLKNHHNVVTMISTQPHKDWKYAYV